MNARAAVIRSLEASLEAVIRALRALREEEERRERGKPIDINRARARRALKRIGRALDDDRGEGGDGA